MMKALPYVLLLVTTISLTSCEKVKNRSAEAAATTARDLKDKRDVLEDKLIAHYDAYTPDTKWNKKRFREWFGIEAECNATGIYAYADELGIDHSYAFSFHCKPQVADSIIRKLGLTSRAAAQNLISPHLPWWHEQRIANLRPYSKRSDHEVFEYLWFDATDSTVYYLMFDL